MLSRNGLNSAVFDLVEHRVVYLEDLSDALQVLEAIGDCGEGELVNSGSHWVIRLGGLGSEADLYGADEDRGTPHPLVPFPR